MHDPGDENDRRLTTEELLDVASEVLDSIAQMVRMKSDVVYWFSSEGIVKEPAD